jgi:glutamate-1-semialdehyde 2,1-aminomutase
MVAVAGLATMSLMTQDAFAELDRMGERVRKRLAEICDGLPLQVTGTGSLFKVTATPHEIRNYRDAASANKAWETTVSLALLNAGFLLTPTLSGTVSLVTKEAEIDALADAFAGIVAH